jgi:hypothetical protein
MSALKLIPVNKNRTGGPWSADDFDVVLVDNGKNVGRIFRQTVAPGDPNEYFCGLDFEAKGPRLFYGSAESKDVAKRAFAKWREI